MRYVCTRKCWHNGTFYREGMTLKGGEPPKKWGKVQNFEAIDDSPSLVADEQVPEPVKKVRAKPGRPKKQK